MTVQIDIAFTTGIIVIPHLASIHPNMSLTMPFAKRLKRHLSGPLHAYFAVTHPGLEDYCRHELAKLSDTISEITETKGGVLFRGRLTDMYLANLCLRTAGRILLRLSEFPATNFRQLGRQMAAVPWELYLPTGVIPENKITCRRSRLYHSQAVDRHVTESIASYWRAKDIRPIPSKTQTLFIRIENDRVTLSLDSSGANLYRRGLKKHVGKAPLRETLAAGVLLIAGYDPQLPLADPMCGSGTFSLEAALIAKHIPPGRHRSFAFMQWPAFKSRQWQYMTDQADQRMAQLTHPMIAASDNDPVSCRRLSQCISRFGLEDAIIVRQDDFFDSASYEPNAPTGLVVLNPPYGRRLKTQGTIESFYTAIASQLQHRYRGWRFALVVPRPDIPGLLPFAAQKTPLTHGGLKLTLLLGDVLK